MGKLTTRVGLLRMSGGGLLAALICTLHATLALCDDLLVMPYTCAIISGRPLLTPSQDQGHQIIGTREQRSFRACSPANPALCREWTIHRFDLDCGGVTVPWAAVAASTRPDRASYESGRLQVRMPPHWNLAADDPCASGERWRYGRLQRYCADRRALSPQATVAMPPGFAPLLGIDAIFVTPSSARGTSPAAAHAPQQPAPPFAASVTRGEPSQAPAKTWQSEPPPPAKQPAAVAQAPPVAPMPAALPAPVVPKIINRTGAVPEPAPAPALPPTVVAEAGPQVGDAPAFTVAPPTPLPAQEAGPQAGDASALTVTSLAALAAHRLPAWMGFAVLAAVLIALTALVLSILRTQRRRLRPQRAAARPATFAARGDRRAVRTQAAAREPAAIWSSVAASSPSWNDEVPRTRSDALRVLGMGVTADANLAAIKKIVDGLRQTWHPDLANDNSDREVREKRMKQINVAWDILAAKPART